MPVVTPAVTAKPLIIKHLHGVSQVSQVKTHIYIYRKIFFFKIFFLYIYKKMAVTPVTPVTPFETLD